MVLDTHLVDADYAPLVAEGAPAAVFLRLADVSVLPGYVPRFSRAFARWVEDFRGDVGARLRRGLVRAITEMRARGRYADVDIVLSRLTRFFRARDDEFLLMRFQCYEAIGVAIGIAIGSC